MRHARQHSQQRQNAGHRQPGRGAGELPADLPRQIMLRRHPRHDHRRGDRQQQRRHLRHQPIANRQQQIGARGIGQRQAMLNGTQHQPADNVDGQDQHTRDRVALHELGRAVHRTVEICLGRHLGAAQASLVGGQQPGVQIGVDRHLLAGHGVEREPRGDLRHSPRALGDDDQVDDHQDGEDENTDNIVAADQEIAERLNDMAGGGRALVAADQHDPGRGDVEAEPQQRRKQQHRRERREIERPPGVDRHHQHDQRDAEIEYEEDVEQQRRDRHHHQQHQRQDAARQQHRARRQPGEPRAHAPRSASRR